MKIKVMKRKNEENEETFERHQEFLSTLPIALSFLIQ